MFRFGLPFTLKCFPFRHKMKTTVKMAQFENGISNFSINTRKQNILMSDVKGG